MHHWLDISQIYAELLKQTNRYIDFLPENNIDEMKESMLKSFDVKNRNNPGDFPTIHQVTLDPKTSHYTLKFKCGEVYTKALNETNRSEFDPPIKYRCSKENFASKDHMGCWIYQPQLFSEIRKVYPQFIDRGPEADGKLPSKSYLNISSKQGMNADIKLQGNISLVPYMIGPETFWIERDNDTQGIFVKFPCGYKSVDIVRSSNKEFWCDKHNVVVDAHYSHSLTATAIGSMVANANWQTSNTIKNWEHIEQKIKSFKIPDPKWDGIIRILGNIPDYYSRLGLWTLARVFSPIFAEIEKLEFYQRVKKLECYENDEERLAVNKRLIIG